MNTTTSPTNEAGLAPSSSPPAGASIRVHDPESYRERLPAWEAFMAEQGRTRLSLHPRWLSILERGLGHRPHVIEAVEGEMVRGLLPLVLVQSALFGRFLVGLPYLNYGGVVASDPETARLLIDRALELAERFKVRHLELRHEEPVDHPRMETASGMKLHMRRALPKTADALWAELGPKVRNQVRKGEKHALKVEWGGTDLLGDFYEVFSRNMRDLGTPVYGRGLFRAILEGFPDRAELCVVRLEGAPIASSLLLHGREASEVPSAGSLRVHNPTCANMLMYWSLLVRAVERGQSEFDFGRSSPASPTHKFKSQWGAKPFPANWSYHVRSGDRSAMRPDNPKNQRLIAIWRRLPVGLTRLIGPSIVRGIP